MTAKVRIEWPTTREQAIDRANTIVHRAAQGATSFVDTHELIEQLADMLERGHGLDKVAAKCELPIDEPENQGWKDNHCADECDEDCCGRVQTHKDIIASLRSQLNALRSQQHMLAERAAGRQSADSQSLERIYGSLGARNATQAQAIINNLKRQAGLRPELHDLAADQCAMFAEAVDAAYKIIHAGK